MVATADRWPVVGIVGTVEELVRASFDVLGDWAKSEPSVAWRGMPRPEWTLRSSLDRLLLRSGAPATISYSACLAREAAIISEFIHRATPFMPDENDACRLHLNNPLEPVIGPMMLGRQYGLPTRIIDWTHDYETAAYFACIEHSDADGVLWWFAHEPFERVIHENWSYWGVPTYLEALVRRRHLKPPDPNDDRWKQRAFSEVAFNQYCGAWVSKLHPVPGFPRLVAQSAFMTFCGRLLCDHNDAIDESPGADEIPRGRIIIKRDAKRGIIDWLFRDRQKHAESLQYPGVDLAAMSIAAEYRHREWCL